MYTNCIHDRLSLSISISLLYSPYSFQIFFQFSQKGFVKQLICKRYLLSNTIHINRLPIQCYKLSSILHQKCQPNKQKFAIFNVFFTLRILIKLYRVLQKSWAGYTFSTFIDGFEQIIKNTFFPISNFFSC